MDADIGTPTRGGSRQGCVQVAGRRVARRWLSLAIVLGGQFMASLDTTIANLAAPSIEQGFRVGAGTAALVVAAYTLVYASALITGARLGADRGRRRVFLAGIAVFTIASTVAGAAPNAAVLIGARAAQGFGAALAVPQVISFIQADFTGVARARALTVYGITISLGATAGIAAGGALIDADVAGLGWRMVFLINLPVGIAVLTAAVRVLPHVRATPRRLDVVGVVLLTTGSAFITGPLALSANAGVPTVSWICLIAGSVLLASFWKWQRRRQDPLLNPAILATPGVRSGLVALLLPAVTYTGTLYCIASELQQHHHATPLRAGLALVPFVAGFGVGSGFGAILPVRFHRLLIVAGTACLATSLIVLGVIASRHWPGGGAALLLSGAGLGYGASFNPTIGRLVANVRSEFIPDASGIATTAFQFSFVVGVAVFGSLYASQSIAVALIAMGGLAALAIPSMLLTPRSKAPR